MTGASSSSGLNNRNGGEGLPDPAPKIPKPKKAQTTAKTAGQLFKKVTLKISESEDLEKSWRKGGMHLGFGIRRSQTIPVAPLNPRP